MHGAQAQSAACQFDWGQEGTPERVINKALELESACKKDEAFLFAFGQRLNVVHLYAEAADRLEGVLLLNPDHWAAQLEYAISLEGMGDALSAEGVLKNLADNPDVGETLKQQIRAQLDKHRLFVAGRKATRTQFGFITGYDNNLMGGARVSQFDLTLPGGRIPVTLSDESRPQGGWFGRLDLSHDGYFVESADKVWSYTLTGNYRYSPENAQANFGLINLLVERGSEQLQGFYTGGALLQLQTPSGSLLRQYQLSSGYDFTAPSSATCRFRLAGDVQRRAYPGADVLNGYYSGIAGYWSCPAWGVQAQIRLGQDRAEYDKRPGGMQDQYGLRVGKNTTIGSGVLAAEVDVYHQEDHRGYSPLLEDNLKRNISRVMYRLEYRKMLSGVGPYAGVEVMEQDSNLPLFRISNRVFYIGIRSMW